jgi:hypothetical protein
MGLLLQQRVTEPDGRMRYPPTNRYTPQMSEAAFVRSAVGEQLDRLLTHYGAIVYDHLARSTQLRPSSDSDEHRCDLCSEQLLDGQPIDATARAMIASLRDRIGVAERKAAAFAFEAERAHREAQSATQQALLAERQAEEARAEERLAHQRMLLAEEEAASALRRSQLQRYANAKAVVEHFDPSGICRVCGQRAAPHVKRRRDGLCLCENPDCKREAQRRDNVIKQRQFQERRRRARAQPSTPA